LNQNATAEQMLVHRVERQLEDANIRGVGRRTLEDALRQVLMDLRLEPEEEIALLPSGSLTPGRLHAIDRFVAARVERAFQAALCAGAQCAGLQAAPVAPRVLVHRTRPLSPQEVDLENRTSDDLDVPPPLPAVGEGRLAELSLEGRGVLVLADAPVAAGYLGRHEGFRIGEHPLGLHLRAGDDATLMSLGESGARAVHVLEFEPGFAQLESILEAAVRARREATARSTRKKAYPRIVPILRRSAPSESPTTGRPAAPPDPPPAAGPTPAPDVAPAAFITAPARDPDDPLVGMVFDEKYLILRRIGKGGFGIVYEARDVRSDHRIAIKLLHPGATRSAEEFLDFENEARRALRLSHPHIVDWQAFEQSHDGVWYLVMELLEGEELDAVMKREGPLDAKRAGRILLQILDALRAAHNLGEGAAVLHLDLKPKNVFLLSGLAGEDAERVKVIDFGIGQFVGAEATSASGVGATGDRIADAEDTWAALDPTEKEQTLLSVHILEEPGVGPAGSGTATAERAQRSTACTPEYAAPEQCAHLLRELRALPLDGRADIYALGVVGFQMLTGQLPYEKPARRKDLFHLKQTLAPMKVGSMGVRVPKKLARFIDRCIARERESRFRDSTEAYEVLHAIVHPPFRKRLLSAAGVFAIGAVAAAVFVGRNLARQGLDLRTRIDGVERSLEGAPLYLGPARDCAYIHVSGLEASSELPAVRVVDGRGDEASEVPGFRAEPQADGGVILSARPAPERVQRPVYLEFANSGRAPRWSVPFDLVWLGEASWELESVEVDGLGERALDPLGAWLEIRLRGAADDLKSVQIERGKRSLAARRDDTRSRGIEGVYRVPLEAFEMQTGLEELRVLATDQAGRVREKSLALPVAPGALVLASVGLDVTAVGGRYSISPRGDPNLRLTASRKADVTWTVKDENGGTLMRGAAKEVLTGEFPLTGLTRLREGRSFSGSIEVLADESAYVLHADAAERGIARQELAFLYAVTAPVYTARLTTPDGGLGKALDPSRPVFTPSREVVVRLGRENSLPLMAQVLCAAAGKAEKPLELAPRILVDRETISVDFPLSLADDGEYAVTVRVWRYDTPDQDTRREPDSILDAHVVVDSTPARLVVQRATTASAGPDLPSETVLRSKSDPLPVLEIRVQDDAKGDALTRTPVDLRWDLFSAQRPEKPIASGILGTVIPGGTSATLGIPAPWSLAAAQPIGTDGNYRILVQGVDAAGNGVVPAEFAFDAAVAGPELELSRPAPRTDWLRGESGGFDLQVVARDPNGVADVRGAIRREGSPEIPFQLHSTGDPRRAEVSVWSGTVSFDETWSNTDIEVRLAAEDGFGTSTRVSATRVLGEVDRLFPRRIAVDFGDVPVETLHLVEGNCRDPYTFGGRIDAEEERVFSSAGLPPFNSLSTPRSWRVAFEPHEIPSFYLDEHEVSVEQYLAFVRAETGYASAANWPAGSTPVPARRASLEQALSAQEDDLPVADVTWEEASAYASWVGKRLPSLVEWEFAVRGGALYRPFASAAGNPKAPSGEEVNYDSFGEGGGERGDGRRTAWPRSQGADVTPDTRIFGLCGNVAEWTATPASFLDGAVTPLDLGAHVRENRALFLDARRFRPAARIERFWVAGGSFHTARADFSVVDRRGRAWRGGGVGFRCAADARSFAALHAPVPSGQPRFLGIQE